MLFIIGLVLSVLFLDWPWQLVVLIPLALVELLEIGLWLRLRGVPEKSGAVMLLGREAEVVTDCAPTGQVRVAGQIWSATADVPALKYSKVVVTGIDGIRLQVTPQSTSG